MHYLNQFNYHGFANGTTRLKLTQAAMKQIPVLLPPLSTQRRIVDTLEDHLSRLDAGLEDIDRSRQRATLMVTASAARQVDSAAGLSVASTVGERSRLVEYGSSSKTITKDGPKAVPVLRMGNIKDGTLDWSSLKYLPNDHPDLARLLLEPGDLLFNRTNSAELVGKCAVFESPRAASFASYLIRVKFDDTVLPRWASLTINSLQGRQYIASVVSQQVGQANVNGTKLKAFPLLVPSLEQQYLRVDEHQYVVDAAKRLHMESTRAGVRIGTLRRAVLATAFSGRLTGHRTDAEAIEEQAALA